jgi:hypothetical protein
MELAIERPHTIEASSVEWPKVPQSKIESKEIAEKNLQQHRPASKVLKKREEVTVLDLSATTQPQTLEADCPSTTLPSEEATKAEAPERRSTTKLGLFGLKKAQWPDPHLSLGTKGNRLAGNECWKAIGPAQELFGLISERIGDLLDARVGDIEEGEPVVHILLFDMYMVGKSAATAQPTLVFTCQRPKPRRRAIKFVKESGILKGHPKILFAESSIPPLAI